MKSIVCEKPWQLKMKERDLPEVKPGEALIRVRRVGMCGTELHAFKGDLAGLDTKIFADVHTKHAMPLAPVPIEHEARECVTRGLADALVVSGPATGQPTALSDLRRVRAAVPDTPILVGSSVTAESVAELLSVAEGVIVGTSVKRDGRVENPVDVARLRRLVHVARHP